MYLVLEGQFGSFADQISDGFDSVLVFMMLSRAHSTTFVNKMDTADAVRHP